MRKFSKLIKSPNLFFRDYFLKRIPLEKTADVNRSKAKYVPKITSILHAVPQAVGFMQPSFLVDFVYTWVDASEEEFFRQRDKYLGVSKSYVSKIAADNARFESRDELRYSIRSVLKYAPWVNKIHIVTNGQIPKWLNLKHPKINLVFHSDIIEKIHLPTFNSHVIESCLHRIPNLTEHYVYFNDDVLLTRPAEKTTFFTESGLALLFLTNARVPNGVRSVEDTPTIWAAKNARKLIFSNYGVYFDHLFAHTFHPQRRSIAEENEKNFATFMSEMRENKFRSESDVLFSSFLNHWTSFINGKGLLAKTTAYYFNVRKKDAGFYYDLLLNKKGTASAPQSTCLNDVTIDDSIIGWEERLSAFLKDYFPDQCSAEIHENSEGSQFIKSAGDGARI